MRELIRHAGVVAGRPLRVAADTTGHRHGQGRGATHRYVISGFDTQANPARAMGEAARSSITLLIQNPAGAGLNGITPDALVAIVEDQLARQGASEDGHVGRLCQHAENLAGQLLVALRELSTATDGDAHARG